MKVVKTVSALFLGIAIAGVGTSSAQALVLFQDNLNEEISGLGKTTLTQWDVTAGTVDVYSPYPLQSLSLDVEGTPGNATIQTKLPFELAGGTYQLSFKIGNNTFSGNSLLVQLGSVFSESFPATSTLTPITRSFTITTPTVAKLSFAAAGPIDLGGAVLDDVVLEQTQATPIPTPVLLPGLVGLGLAAFKQRKSKSVDAEA
jgi:hypothetical protein